MLLQSKLRLLSRLSISGLRLRYCVTGQGNGGEVTRKCQKPGPVKAWTTRPTRTRWEVLLLLITVAGKEREGGRHGAGHCAPLLQEIVGECDQGAVSANVFRLVNLEEQVPRVIHVRTYRGN